jgi:hypothetical protein
MSVKNDLNELIRKWVETRQGFPVTEAYLGEYTSAYDYGGCETCGPDITKEFDIWYKVPGYSQSLVMTVEGDPLSWLANTLLDFEDEINKYEDSIN